MDDIIIVKYNEPQGSNTWRCPKCKALVPDYFDWHLHGRCWECATFGAPKTIEQMMEDYDLLERSIYGVEDER